MTRLDYRQRPYGSWGWCHLDVYDHMPGVPPVAIVTEMADNDGLSITNGAEHIHDLLVERYGPDVLHVEHYGPISYPSGRRRDEWAVVTIDNHGHPHWNHIPQDVLVRLIGGETPVP